MPGPFVDDTQIEFARELARETTRPVLELIRRHTTVSIERTVLRLFGISGAGSGGVPLANVMVDRLHEAGVLNRGAAYWYGRAFHLGARSPAEAVERLIAAPLQKLPALPPETEAKLREEVRAEARASVEDLRHRIRVRDDLRSELGMPPPPHKYVIVATGNIHDDVDQAQAAAQAGADVIAVIRSTAQSLLDYVPHGATTEGYGGTYATQENFRIMREALDLESPTTRCTEFFSATSTCAALSSISISPGGSARSLESSSIPAKTITSPPPTLMRAPTP